MQKTPLYAEERKQKIMNYIEINARCSVGELAELFDITPVTIRSDLRDLEKSGKIIRTHGGAVLRSKTEHEDFVDERKNHDKKFSIAEKAVEFLHDGDSIALDTGTTALAFANAIVNSAIRNLKIITPDVLLIHTLEQRQDFEIISLGGQVRHGFHFACGDMTLQMLDNFHVDKFFLTTSAIDLVHGLTTPNPGTANLKAKMISIAKETNVLVDSTKFNKVCFCKICDFDRIERIIVDDGLHEETRKALQQLVPAVFLA